MTVSQLDPAVSSDIKIENTLPSVHGIMALHNNKGQSYTSTTLEKWLHVAKNSFKNEKLDVLADAGSIDSLASLLRVAPVLQLKLWPRIDAATDPAVIERLREPAFAGIVLDIFAWNSARIEIWQSFCTNENLPLRINLFCAGALPAVESVVGALEHASSVAVHYADPLAPLPRAGNAVESAVIVNEMNRLTAALLHRRIPVTLHALPFCHVAPSNYSAAINSLQRLLDYQQYEAASFNFALQMSRLSPARAETFVEIEAGKNTSFHRGIDNLVLPWILNKPYLYVRIWALHKLLRYARPIKHRLRPLAGKTATAQKISAAVNRNKITITSTCAQCSFQRICDHKTEMFKQHLPDLQIIALAGPLIADTILFTRDSLKFTDEIDSERLATPNKLLDLAAEAVRVMAYERPTREIKAEDYAIEQHDTHRMPNAIRWTSFARTELLSTPLCRIQPPFTFSFVVAGGIAQYVGFSFGRECKLLCPMVSFNHRITLHVNAAGDYVLLRDDVVMRLVAFENGAAVPRRLATVLEPRISLWNIDGQIVTQTLLLWQPEQAAPPAAVRYSVIVISTCYSRRLQAALLSLINQHDFAMQAVEIVVGYVPGVDATDDLLDTLALSHPHIRFVRAPFPAAKIRSKGFMINEALGLASGEWVILMDADILVPPRFFAELDPATAHAVFIAPDGREMLSAETTAKILLGEIKPWEEFEGLSVSGVEYRHREAEGLPIGFCQCVRRDIFEKVTYVELDHFEGSDWLFAKQVIDIFGKETRLENTKVLHLDHGGSQWYGTRKQM